MKNMAGLTFQIVFGKWAKPKICCGKGAFVICLGWVSIAFVLYDMEIYVYNTAKMLTDLQAEIAQGGALPSDLEVEEWFSDNIDNDSASSAICKFRLWLKEYNTN